MSRKKLRADVCLVGKRVLQATIRTNLFVSKPINLLLNLSDLPSRQTTENPGESFGLFGDYLLNLI